VTTMAAHPFRMLVGGELTEASGGAELPAIELLAHPEAGLLRPLTHRFAERVLHDDYAGGMPTEAARKDSTLALAMAQETGVPLFAVQAAHTVYELAVAGDLGRLDYASIAGLWERWTGRVLADTAGDAG
jgi:3-hydroxyisobutyrate dehydrogenase-like beta-hydroxyacid dehydrogenase